MEIIGRMTGRAAKRPSGAVEDSVDTLTRGARDQVCMMRPSHHQLVNHVVP